MRLIRMALGSALVHEEEYGVLLLGELEYLGPLVLHPPPDVVLVPLHGPEQRHLGGEAQAPHHPPDVRDVVADAELLLDDLRHPLECPEFGRVAVLEGASLEYALQSLLL